MDDYTIIEERFKSLPKDIQLALSSTQVSEIIKGISNRHELMLDQASELFDLTSDVMLGLSPAKDFVANLSKKAGIKEEKASSIAKDINKEIFDSIRTSLQKIQEQAEKMEPPQPARSTSSAPAAPLTPPPTPVSTNYHPIAAVEKAGNFSIHQPTPSHSPQYNDSALRKEVVLNDLENIEKLRPENANNFVEHLLSNPTSRPAQTEEKKPEVQKTSPPSKKYDTDPYREQP